MIETNNCIKKRILEAAAHLFGLQGFDGTSTREIARMAKVNIASLSYHFQSKKNLMQEVSGFACQEFSETLNRVSKLENKDTAEYAQKVFVALGENGARCLNQFKLFLDAENCPLEFGETPMGFEQLAKYLDKELKPQVPKAEKLWLSNVIYSYIIHMAVVSKTSVGKAHIQKFFPNKEKSTPLYIRQLVETLIRDLNYRYQ